MSIAATQDFSYMGDPQLQQALQFAKRANNSLDFLSIKAEIDKRAKTRNAAQGQQAGQQLASEGPRTEADKVMAGIANLSSGDHEYANGGIVAFAGGDLVEEKQRAADREAMLDTLRKMKAAGMDVLTMPGRAVAGAAESAITRPLRAMGVDVPYLPDSFYGGNRESATPYMDKLRGEQAAPVTPAAPSPIEPRQVRTPELYREAAGAQQAPPAPGAGPGITALTRRTASTTTPAAAPAAPEQRILTAAEQMAADEALAKGRNDKVAAIYAKADARDAKRRAELEGETKATKGLLGIEMDPDIRKAMRTAGIGMLKSQRADTFGALGEGLEAASKGYDETKQKRQARLDLLDDAEEKRQMAKMAAEQGNMDLASKYSKQEADLREKAAGRAFEEKKFASTEAHQRDLLKMQERQIGQSAANAARNPQLEIYRALGKGDVNKGFDVYTQGRGAGAADLASWKAYAADPAKLAALKIENPVLYAQVLTRIQGQLGAGAPGVPGAAGTVRER